MKINFEPKTIGSSVWSYDNEEYDIVLNLGSIPDELHDVYIKKAREILDDDMSEEQLEYCLTHGIWESL